MGTAIDSVFEADYAETPLAEIPMMADIKNYDQIDLVLDLASGSSTEWWIVYTNTRYNQQIAAGGDWRDCVADVPVLTDKAADRFDARTLRCCRV